MANPGRRPGQVDMTNDGPNALQAELAPVRFAMQGAIDVIGSWLPMIDGNLAG